MPIRLKFLSDDFTTKLPLSQNSFDVCVHVRFHLSFEGSDVVISTSPKLSFMSCSQTQELG